MRLFDRAWLRTGFLGVALFTLFAGDVWRYTVGWWGFAVVAATLTAVAVALIVNDRPRWRSSGVPIPLVAFLALAIASLAWSAYPSATAVGLGTTVATTLVAVALAVSFEWSRLLEGLSGVLKVILAASFVFELVVAVIIRRPVLPLVPQPGIDYTVDPVPKLLQWSRNELFSVLDGGRIQGIVGSSATLGILAVIAVAVFAIQLVGRETRHRRDWAWIGLAVAALAATRPATAILAAVAVAVAVAAVLFVRRTRPGVGYGVVGAGLAVGLTGAVVFRSQIFAALGKSDDLTGRTEIWDAVISLASQRPVFGWGWVSYWAPWVAPFDTLAENNGVRQLHAHNAWLDVWLQLGVVGLVVVGALVLSTAARSWTFAVDRHGVTPASAGRFRAVSLLPLALLVILIVQSLTESRLLVEYGWALLVLIAVKTRADEGSVLAR